MFACNTSQICVQTAEVPEQPQRVGPGRTDVPRRVARPALRLLHVLLPRVPCQQL